MSWDSEQARQEIARAETLLSDLGAGSEPVAGAHAIEAVRAVVGLYGECLGRMVRSVEQAGHTGLAAEFAGDELVSHLLLVHDLHPVALEDRITGAIAEVSRTFDEPIRLLDVRDGAARVRVEARGCGSPRMHTSVRAAVLEAAPELDRVEIDATAEPDAVIPVDDLFPRARS
ncbi:nitrogen fixation protein NifU [Saccharopolyspora taberi]|uniref:NifU family protein n=1 Tax=Saccharopolyspora taberi TaxID=60895 RepID=A0ABN3VHI3_9PSEU